MTAEDTITDAQIESLRVEAIEHGDDEMVSVCDSALNSASPALRAEARDDIAQMIAEPEA